MTETGAGATIVANRPPHDPGKRCIGRPAGCEARIVDDDDDDVPDGTPGNLIVRKSAENPRRLFFSGYYKDEATTERDWRGGWFHTGDVAMRAPDGRFYFVDRDKNIIRRSGENIAALEVDTELVKHPAVAQVAVIAAPDPVRGEEVMACVVPAAGPERDGERDRERDEATAREPGGVVPRPARLLQGAGMGSVPGRTAGHRDQQDQEGRPEGPGRRSGEEPGRVRPAQHEEGAAPGRLKPRSAAIARTGLYRRQVQQQFAQAGHAHQHDDRRNTRWRHRRCG